FFKINNSNSFLEMKDVSVVESCTFAHDMKKMMFLEDHMLLFVMEGTYRITIGNDEFDVNKFLLVT
uniref:hypothetical protein n=1 Tax=Chryseobacterium sp. sg2396 TaxID=3276280 RepID=UPI003672C559